MTDLERILPLRRELDAAQADYVLATVVAVDGPSYRKPGACMLLAPGSRRAGTVSGGCLEAQVAARAWWLTANGPSIQRYSTAEDDGERPYGSGCGGAVSILLERRPTAAPFLDALEQAFHRRIPIAVATILDGPHLGLRAFAGLAIHSSPQAVEPLQSLANQALARCRWIETEIGIDNAPTRIRVDYRPARPALWIFGAGDDAQPLLQMGKQLGWHLVLADGRSHLPTPERFPLADELRTLSISDLPISLPDSGPNPLGDLRPHDAALLLTHSFEQDARILALLLTLPQPPAYIGVLGPQRRTRELLTEVARLPHAIPSGPDPDAQIDRWLNRLYSPTGLDLGADSPETIALSILAEIQKVLTSASARPLRELRADLPNLAL